MQRACFLLRVRPDRLDEYRARHREVWPEMEAALRDSGWSNYSLFLAADGLLVGYVEADDFERARLAIEATDVNRRWQASVADLFQPGDTPGREAGPKLLEEVFHLG